MIFNTNNNKAEETSFTNYFSRKNLTFKINNLNYLPRWIIILIDCTVLILSFLLTYLLFRGTGLDYIIRTHASRFIALFFGINIFFFWLFRTYAGIIRHSSYIDAVKLLFSQLSVLLFFLFLNFSFELIYGQKAFSNIALFITVVLSFCGLFLYRIIVKQTFDLYFSKKNNHNLIKLIIYGTDANAIYVAKALKFETPSRFKILGFVDKNNKNATKRMLDLPIFVQGKKLPSLMRSVGAEGIILADTKFEWGKLKSGEIILIDEALTPDSSRFWDEKSYATGISPPSFDKQFIRDWLETTTWDKNSPPPEMPQSTIAQTRLRYLEAFKILTGKNFV